MRFNSLMTIAAASAVIAFAGCSANSTSAVSPIGSPGQARTTHFAFGHSTSLLPPALQARLAHPVRSNPNVSHNSCPATGLLIYVSDAANGVVNIYNSAQSLCGTLSGFVEPQGMTVRAHNLYVANTLGNADGAGEIDAYHRGATTPFKRYVDTTGGGQYVVDVSVTSNAVIGSNIFGVSAGGSISGWQKNGAFVSNVVEPNMDLSYFVDATDDGTMFSDGFDNVFFAPTMWQFTCPFGACTSGTELGQVMSFPGGITDTKSGDILAADQTSDTGDTFEMPSLSPATFATTSGGDTVTLGAVQSVGSPTQVFGPDAAFNQTVCYNYHQNGSSSGTCGTIPGNSGGQALGIALDPGQ